MLSAPARKASAMPRPIRMSGTARTRVAEVSAYHEPKAPRQSAPIAAAASYPASWSPAASRTTPSSTAISGVLAGTGHHELADLRARSAVWDLGHDAARRDQNSVRERQYLVEVARVDQDRGAVGGGLAKPPMHRLRGAQVESARRILGDHHARLARQLAADHDLLLVPPAERRGRHVRPRRHHAELAQQAGGPRPGDFPIHPPPANPRVVGPGPEHHVLGERERGNQSFRRAVLRNERHRPRDLAAPPQRLQAPRDGPEQLALPVPFHGRDADDLARADTQS